MFPSTPTPYAQKGSIPSLCLALYPEQDPAMAFNRFNPPDKKPSGLSAGIGGLVEAEKLMQIALVMPISAAIGLLAGWWLSNLLHHKWIEIAGILFGCAAGLFYTIQTAIAAEKKTTTRDEDPNGAGKGTPSSDL